MFEGQQRLCAGRTRNTKTQASLCRCTHMHTRHSHAHKPILYYWKARSRRTNFASVVFFLVSWIVTNNPMGTAFARTNQSNFKEFLMLRHSVVTTSLVIGPARLTSNTCGPVGNGMENLLSRVKHPNNFLLPLKTIPKPRYCQGFCLCPLLLLTHQNIAHVRASSVHWPTMNESLT